MANDVKQKIAGMAKIFLDVAAMQGYRWVCKCGTQTNDTQRVPHQNRDAAMRVRGGNRRVAVYRVTVDSRRASS